MKTTTLIPISSPIVSVDQDRVLVSIPGVNGRIPVILTLEQTLRLDSELQGAIRQVFRYRQYQHPLLEPLMKGDEP